MVEGEIYFGKRNLKGRHPIVFLSDIDEYSFNGLMLTHSAIKDNAKLSAEHFEWVKDNFDTDNTHVVRRKLIKKNEWKPFVLVGKLSGEGLGFVRKLVKGKTAEYF